MVGKKLRKFTVVGAKKEKIMLKINREKGIFTRKNKMIISGNELDFKDLIRQLEETIDHHWFQHTYTDEDYENKIIVKTRLDCVLPEEK